MSGPYYVAAYIARDRERAESRDAEARRQAELEDEQRRRRKALKTAKKFLVQNGFSKEVVDQMRLTTKIQQESAIFFLLKAKKSAILRDKIRSSELILQSSSQIIGLTHPEGSYSLVSSITTENAEVLKKRHMIALEKNRFTLETLSPKPQETQPRMSFVETLRDFELLENDERCTSLLVNPLDFEVVTKAVATRKQIFLVLPDVEFCQLDPSNLGPVVRDTNKALVELVKELLDGAIQMGLAEKQKGGSQKDEAERSSDPREENL